MAERTSLLLGDVSFINCLGKKKKSWLFKKGNRPRLIVLPYSHNVYTCLKDKNLVLNIGA